MAGNIFMLAVIAAAICLMLYMFFKVIDSEAKQDFRDIEKNAANDSLRKTWHRQSFLKIFGIGVGVSLPFFYFSWQAVISVLIINGSFFWILFDKKLNLLRNLSWNYVGKTAGVDVLFNKRFGANSWRIMLACKVLTLLFGWAWLLISVWKWLGVRPDLGSLFRQ